MLIRNHTVQYLHDIFCHKYHILPLIIMEQLQTINRWKMEHIIDLLCAIYGLLLVKRKIMIHIHS